MSHARVFSIVAADAARLWISAENVMCRRKKENAMTSTNIRTKTAFAISFLGILAILMPTTCRAQAEIDPDHYDTPIDDTKARVVVKPSSANTKRSRENFRGKFFLPFDVAYAGIILPRGSYSVRGPSLSGSNSVTFIPDGSAVRIQAIPTQLLRPSDVEGRNCLVLERTGAQRTLIAVRLEEPRVLLVLPSKDIHTSDVSRELVPISSSDR
jgi:hypothetical protein